MQTKVRDRQAEAVLAEALNNVAPESMFGAPQRSPFGAPQASLVASKSASLSPPEKLHQQHLVREHRIERDLKRRWIIILDNAKKSGRAKFGWIPASEYYQSYEEYYDNMLLRDGDAVDLTEAQISRMYMDGYGPDVIGEEELNDAQFLALGITDVTNAHYPADPYVTCRESPLWEDLGHKAKEYRAELLRHPDLVTSVMDESDYFHAGIWAGVWSWDGHRSGLTSEAQALIDIADDSQAGIGAAIVDYALWNLSITHRLCVEFTELLDQIRQEDYTDQEPEDNLIFSPASLHQDTPYDPESNVWKLHSGYEVSSVSYYTDPDFEVIGYRDAFMVPCGKLDKPTLEIARNRYGY